MTAHPEKFEDDARPPALGASSVHAGDDAVARLMQVGYSDPTVPRQALQDGLSAAHAAITPLHPAAYAGMRMWAETTFSLAHLGRESGWIRETFRGVDVIANHRTGTAVIVTAGDGATGDRNHNPQVRYERRDITTGLVNGDLDTLWDAERGRADWNVWFLLHNLPGAQASVPAELSLPDAIAPNGLVTRWVERIIVPAHGGGVYGVDRKADSSDAPRSPVVTVKRRVG